MTTSQETHILLVDDYEAFREGLRLSLEELGYVVHSAADAQQALHLFHVQPIDLALLDVEMPAMDGFTLYAELRKQRPVPVIFLSARHQERHHALSLGAAAFLNKPFLLSELDHSIQSALSSTS